MDFPTEAKDVFDVSGAGDTVIASIAAGLAGGFSLSESIKLANIAAGIVVGKSGTATVNKAEITPFINKAEAYMSLEEAESFVLSLRQKGKKIIKGTEKNLGGTMRLGLYDAILKNNSLIS